MSILQVPAVNKVQMENKVQVENKVKVEDKEPVTKPVLLKLDSITDSVNKDTDVESEFSTTSTTNHQIDPTSQDCYDGAECQRQTQCRYVHPGDCRHRGQCINATCNRPHPFYRVLNCNRPFDCTTKNCNYMHLPKCKLGEHCGAFRKGRCRGWHVQL